MNSSKYHRLEKIFYRCLFSFLFLILPTIIAYVLNKESTITMVLTTLLRIALLAAIISHFYLRSKTKGWLAQGKELSQQLGLKRLLLMEGYYPERGSNVRVIEIHHYLGPFSDGKAFSKRDRKDVLDEFKSQLHEDFRKLAEWKDNQPQNIVVLMSTHPAMKRVYERSSSPYFDIVKSERVLDPYVGMNIYEWSIATYLTSGRWDFKSPKQWDGYYFYRPNEQRLGEEY